MRETAPIYEWTLSKTVENGPASVIIIYKLKNDERRETIYNLDNDERRIIIYNSLVFVWGKRMNGGTLFII